MGGIRISNLLPQLRRLTGRASLARTSRAGGLIGLIKSDLIDVSGMIFALILSVWKIEFERCGSRSKADLSTRNVPMVIGKKGKMGLDNTKSPVAVEIGGKHGRTNESRG
jgi:hypothetical protein